MATKKEPPKSWSDLGTEYDAMWRMSCVPKDMKKLKVGTIIDEEKSVRWNREEVERNNQAYLDEVARLNKERNRVRDAIHEDIYRAIQAEIRGGLTRKQAIAVWNFAYENGHANGWNEIMWWLGRVEELATILRS